MSTLIDEVLARQLPPRRVRVAIRRRAGVTPARMATELGIHRSTLWRWENGEFDPQGDNAARYARLLEQLQEVTR